MGKSKEPKSDTGHMKLPQLTQSEVIIWIALLQSQTRLNDLAWMHALEKEMATYSRILALRIPGTEEPGGLPSMGSHIVGHGWSDLAAATANKPQARPEDSS